MSQQRPSSSPTEFTSSQLSLTSTLVNSSAQPALEQDSLRSSDLAAKDFLKSYGIGGGLSMDGFRQGRPELLKSKPTSKKSTSKDDATKTSQNQGDTKESTSTSTSILQGEKVKVNKEKNKVEASAQKNDSSSQAGEGFASTTCSKDSDDAKPTSPRSSPKTSPKAAWRKLFKTRET